MMLLCLRALVAGTGADILSTTRRLWRKTTTKLGAEREKVPSWRCDRLGGRVGVLERSYNEYQHEPFSNPSRTEVGLWVNTDEPRFFFFNEAIVNKGLIRRMSTA